MVLESACIWLLLDYYNDEAYTLNGSYVGGLYSIILRNNVVYVTFTDSIQAKDPVIVINI